MQDLLLGIKERQKLVQKLSVHYPTFFLRMGTAAFLDFLVIKLGPGDQVWASGRDTHIRLVWVQNEYANLPGSFSSFVAGPKLFEVVVLQMTESLYPKVLFWRTLTP